MMMTMIMVLAVMVMMMIMLLMIMMIMLAKNQREDATRIYSLLEPNRFSYQLQHIPSRSYIFQSETAQTKNRKKQNKSELQRAFSIYQSGL